MLSRYVNIRFIGIECINCVEIAGLEEYMSLLIAYVTKLIVFNFNIRRHWIKWVVIIFNMLKWELQDTTYKPKKFVESDLSA